jgi:D-aminopeptidase
MELARVEQAEAAALVPGVEIIEPGTVGFTAANGLEAADIVALLLETTGA